MRVPSGDQDGKLTQHVPASVRGVLPVRVHDGDAPVAAAAAVRVGEAGAVGRPGRIGIGTWLLRERTQASALLVDGVEVEVAAAAVARERDRTGRRPGGLAVDPRVGGEPRRWPRRKPA